MSHTTVQLPADLDPRLKLVVLKFLEQQRYITLKQKFLDAKISALEDQLKKKKIKKFIDSL